MDRFDTPSAIAQRMVELVNCKNVRVVGDFAAGTGELIKQAQRRWPSAVFLATDISRTMVSKLRREQSSWLVGKCDFLSSRSRRLCSVTSELKDICVVLLNPPFSCRGAARFDVDFKNSIIQCSLALSFVFESVQLLRRGGQLIALLPAGSLTSEKDKGAWKVLHDLFEIRTFGINDHTTFRDVSAETVIVRISNRQLKPSRVSFSQTPAKLQVSSSDSASIVLVRGKLPMYLTNGYSGPDYLPLVHTTELLKDGINVSARRIKPSKSAIRGPAVFLPRVGNPSQHKIKLYLKKEPVVLSDCVIALRCGNTEEAKHLHSVLLQKWDKLEAYYVGTCAKYITIRSLQMFFRSIGLRVAVTSSSAVK